jgi:hypothetical protein
VLSWEPKVTFKQLVRLMVDHDLKMATKERMIADQEGGGTPTMTRWGSS